MSFITKAQNDPIKLKYLGTAGWKITDGNITVLIDPYISRVKLGTGPGVSSEDHRDTVKRSDYFVSDTLSIDSLVSKVDFILVHHSHFDHLSDVPYIAKKTGAKVIGTETTCNKYSSRIWYSRRTIVSRERGRRLSVRQLCGESDSIHPFRFEQQALY